MEHEFKTVHYICNGEEVYSQSYREDSIYYDGDLKDWFDDNASTCNHSIRIDLNTQGQ